MARLIIPVGIPGCGKSTLCSTLLDVRRVSSDEIRQRVCPDGYDATKNSEVFAEYHQQIAKNLMREIDTVADATNLEISAREKLYNIARFCNAEAHVLLFTNIEQALKRNAARPVDGKHGNMQVPQDQMANKMLPRYERTLASIDTEAYDTLTYIGENF